MVASLKANGSFIEPVPAALADRSVIKKKKKKIGKRSIVSQLAFFTQSTAKDYIGAENELQSIS